MIDAVSPVKLQEAKPKKIKPTWFMDVYAINLLILTCLIAPKLPTNIEPIDTNIKIGWKKNNKLKNKLNVILIKKSIKPTLITIAKNAVIGVQIPS